MKITVIVFLLVLLNSILIAQTNYDRHKVADSNLIVKNDWGIYFTKCSDWYVKSNTRNEVVCISSGDKITIDYISGDSITDNDAKFGWKTYWYDNNKKQWMYKLQEDEEMPPGIVTKTAIALAVLSDGFPVFEGTGRWRTIIIPLSHTSFLKCNIIGGGWTDALLLITEQ